MKRTVDKFLSGLVMLEQPAEGYRAGIDAVLLAAAVDARPDQKILELGCGAGAAMLCLAARVPHLAITGVELQPEYLAYAEANITRNAALGAFHVLQGDARKLPRTVPANAFDHIMINPPYHDREAHSPSSRRGKNLSHAMSEGDLTVWIRSAHGRLKHKGSITIIHNINGLSDIFNALNKKFGGIEIMPLWPKAGQPAKRILLRARKDSKAPTVLLPGLILHNNKGSYIDEIACVLKSGRPLPWQKP